MARKEGVSLISLVITIIVIMIIATIVIARGFGATENAEFAKFAQEISDYQDGINQRYFDVKSDNVQSGIRKKDSVIYSEMGTQAGTIADVLEGRKLQKPLNGTDCYLLESDSELYDDDARIYVTDKGEVFTIPGYLYTTNGEERYYVSAGKYYLLDETVDPLPGEIIAGDLNHYDPSAENWELLGKIADAIAERPDITSNSSSATVGVDGKEYTIGVGDTFKVVYDNYVPGGNTSGDSGDLDYRNGEGGVTIIENVTGSGDSSGDGMKQSALLTVRVLGFNHDTLASNSSKKAGISFEFVDFIMMSSFHNTSVLTGGWVASNLYDKLNSVTNGAWKNMSFSEEIKKVKKTYATSYTANTTNVSEDYLWLLAASEILGARNRPYTLINEGNQYKFYMDNIPEESNYSNILKKPSIFFGGDGKCIAWWLRSMQNGYGSSNCRFEICGSGLVGIMGTFPNYMIHGVAPGFSI